MKRFILLLQFVFVALGASPTVVGQNFPVQITPQALPPAPIYFSSYADATTTSSPLRVQIALNALGIGSREVRLKVYFEGNGISFQSNDLVTGATPLFLEGGIPLILTNIELASYFRFENIVGISPTVYGNPIPEGSYNICFEVFDSNTGRRISGRTCTTTLVFQNEPPILIAPQNKAIVEDRNPQNIIFQWVPRHINVSNVEYELSIVEIWDNQVDPQAAFLSSPPIFQTITTNTTYLYGPIDPLLLKDRNYAWRVRAIAKEGIEEIGTFKNKGFSEIFYFGHSEQCELPLAITADVKGATNANILWQDTSTSISEITVRYRKKGTDAWFDKKSTADFLTLWDLEPGTEYEYQIVKSCVIAESGFSPIQTFRTNLFDDDDSTYNCGIAPDIDVTNQVPLESISNGDKFTAGDFPVTIMEVSGGSGYFTGKGYVTIPYLKSIKVAVEFTNIFINQNKELAQGHVVTVFDPNMGGIIDPWDFIDDVGDIINGGDVIVLYPVDFDITGARVSEDGEELIITGTDANGNQVEHSVPYDEADSYQVTGSNGVFNVGPDGATPIGDLADGGVPNADNTLGLGNGNGGTVKDPKVTVWADTDVVISFRADALASYGYDEANNSYEEAKYPKVSLASGGEIHPIHKAVVDGESDTFLVDIEFKEQAITKEDLVFKTVNGLALTAENTEANTYRISVSGYNGYSNEEAIITYKNAEDKQVVIGSFFIHHLRPLERADVKIITVNGATMPNGLAQIAQKFNSAGADVNLIADQNVQLNTASLAYTGSGLLRKLPESFRNFANGFKNSISNYSKETYYIFVFDETVDPGPITGFMPRGTQYGFVFSKNINTNIPESKKTVEDVIMHEIGHGVFGISHPADDNLGTDWAMDKGNGNQLAIRDWEAMGDKGLRLYWFDDDDDAAYIPKLNYKCIPSSISKPSANETYYTHRGEVIVLNSRYAPFAFVGTNDNNGPPNGSLAVIREISSDKLYWLASNDNRYRQYYAKNEDGEGLNINDVFSEFSLGNPADALRVLIDDDCSYLIKKGENTISNAIYQSDCNCFSNTNGSDTSGRIVDNTGLLSDEDKTDIARELNSLEINSRVVVFENAPTPEELDNLQKELNSSPDLSITIAYLETNTLGEQSFITKTLTSLLADRDLNRFEQISKELAIEFTKVFGRESIDFLKLKLIGDTQLLQFISDLIDKAKVPEKYWNPEHVDYPSQMPLIARLLNVGTGDFFSIFSSTEGHQIKFAFKAGLWNGIADELKALPDLAILVSDYFLDEQKRKEINESFKQLTVEKIWDSFKAAHGYENGQITNQFKLSHQLGKDVIFIASFFTGVGAITKAGKISKIGDIAKLISSGAIKFIKQLPENVKNFVNDIPSSISKSIVSGYLVLKLRTANIARIAESGELRDLKWIDQGQVLRLTDDELAILQSAKYLDEVLKEDVLLLIQLENQIGFKVKRGFIFVEDFTPALILKMAKPLNRIPTIGKQIVPTLGKTTTILGNYRKDIQYILEELEYPKTEDFGAKSGGYNLLNVRDELYKNPQQFWDQFNRPFLNEVIARGDEIVLATKPTDDVLNVFDETGNIIGRSGFGREYDYLISKGYRFDEGSGKMVKRTTGSIVIPPSLINKFGSATSKLEEWLSKNSNSLPDNISKLLDELEINLNSKEVQDVFEDGYGRFVVLTNSETATRTVVTLNKVSTGEIKSFKYANGYNKAGQAGKPKLSVNGMTPDFSGNINWLFPIIGNQRNIVKIKLTGKRNGSGGDFDLANKAANIESFIPTGKWKPDGYTWHHMDDFDPVTGESTMQLVRTTDHQGATPHVGSVKQWENYNERTYK